MSKAINSNIMLEEMSVIGTVKANLRGAVLATKTRALLPQPWRLKLRIPPF